MTNSYRRENFRKIIRGKLKTDNKHWKKSWDTGKFTYEEILWHTKSHSLKEWLLSGAEDEDAQTIGRAVFCKSDEQLARGLARMLSGA